MRPGGHRMPAGHRMDFNVGCEGLENDVGRRFDAVWVRPLAGDPLDVCLRHAVSAEDALAKIFALGGDADVAGVWVAGRRVKGA